MISFLNSLIQYIYLKKYYLKKNDFVLLKYWMPGTFVNREWERERERAAAIQDKMHQTATSICIDAIHSPNALKERTRSYRYIELRGLFSASILLLPLSLRSLSSDTSLNRTIFSDSMANRDFTIIRRFHREPIVRLKSDSLDSIKAHLSKDYAKNDRRCVTAAINNHVNRRNGVSLIYEQANYLSSRAHRCTTKIWQPRTIEIYFRFPRFAA